VRCIERDAPLFLADDKPVPEMDLPEATAERPGVDSCLERRDACPTVKLGAPRTLVGIDPQAKASIDLVTRR
jgi:hypothetical protein